MSRCPEAAIEQCWVTEGLKETGGRENEGLVWEACPGS